MEPLFTPGETWDSYQARVRGISKSCPSFQHRPPITAFEGDIVSIVVGPDNSTQTFKVHKGLLTHYFEYFRGAFKNEHFIEAQSGVVRLKEDDPSVFKLVYNFLYTGTLYDGMTMPKRQLSLPARNYGERGLSGLPVDSRGKESDIPLTFEQLFDLYVFANARICLTLENIVVSLVFEKALLDKMLHIDDLVYSEEKPHLLLACNRLAAALAYIVAKYTPASLISDNYDRIPAAFLAEIISVKDELIDEQQHHQPTTGRTLDMCRFHDHGRHHVVDITSQPENKSSDPYNSDPFAFQLPGTILPTFRF
ncbi:hypothetical protein BDV96DRAFT_567322 [Lophiotrema nucula]|uniref:BTB domain-containing protein n=1 Tax=Lophiotrema nucula TaxID=690887 RepID=A0A6A5ZJ57_9PLEO|nr:hypothetical protein BDV96DRAFT_567322 [Lophiotrema nucula]